MSHRAKLLLALSLPAFLTGSLLSPLTPAVTAGNYEVRNCGGSGSAWLDGQFERYGDGRIEVDETCRNLPGGSITIKQRNHGGVIPNGYGGGYRWQAPSGASIIGSSVRGRLRNANGVAAQIYATNSNGGFLRLDSGAPHDGAVRDMEVSFPNRPRSQFVARLACLTSPPCSNRRTDPTAYVQVRRLSLELRDRTPPSVTAGGRLFTGSSTIRGSVGYSLSASDDGGGVWKLHAEINGHQVALATVSCAGDRGGYADRMRPCPSSTSHSGRLDTSEPPFRQGGNTVRLCARDYANGHPGTPTGPNTGCSASRTVTVDNVAPPPPPGLRTEGGEGWRAANEFSVAWEGPSNLVTPVVEARYRLVDSSGRTTSEGIERRTGVTGIDSISVPDVGEYRLHVRLRDGAGNTGPPASTMLRFDDRLPGPTGPEIESRWLSAADFPAELRLRRALPGGPSGIAGYAVSVGSSKGNSPCPSGLCDPSEMTLRQGADHRTVVIDRLEEGRHWISAVAVSGAAVPSEPSLPHPVNVDLTDPTTIASGVPRSWSRSPVTVSVSARDEGSGMRPDPGHEGPQPLTAVSVNGGDPVFRIGDRVAVTISTDGIHEVRHWARDLAGNSNSGQRLDSGHRHDEPGTEIVKVDTSPPSIRFASEADPERPERVRAFASDPHSGVASGRIEYRPAGSGRSFEALETTMQEGWLTAELPSDELPDGAYELRALAWDRAGNAAATTQREDGSAMLLVNPVKPRPQLRVSWRGERRMHVAPRPGRPAVVEGRLRDAEGSLLIREPVELIEHFDRGSRQRTRVTPLSTDRSGRFRARLAGGPSRTVSARYRGSDMLSRASSSSLRLIGRGAIRLGMTPRIARNNQAIRMRGTVRSRGALAPPGGKLVAIQYLDPDRGRWRPVEVIRADRRGRFAYAYRFRTIAFPQRIVFRAVSLPEAGWPYLPAASRPSPVVVYPR